jgi:hypothetical protein
MQAAGVAADHYRLEADPADSDRQTLLFWYPVVTTRAGDYVRSAVKIESGAKSALDPHVSASVKPYVTEELPELDLEVANVTTVDPGRTFWDKIVILHGLRQWYDRRGEIRQGGQRVSRHHYDVFKLLQAKAVEGWVSDRALAVDCARHAQMFFNSADLDLARAIPGTFTLTPSAPMREPLRRDFEAMAGMIFGNPPDFDSVLSAIAALEARLN